MGEQGESLVEIEDVAQPPDLVMREDDQLSWEISAVEEVLSLEGTLRLCGPYLIEVLLVRSHSIYVDTGKSAANCLLHVLRDPDIGQQPQSDQQIILYLCSF